jgi:tRNA (guanine37-N1)-methyltransferase
MDVPEILRSGNDKLIEAWRHEQAVQRPMQRRPDLLAD